MWQGGPDERVQSEVVVVVKEEGDVDVVAY